MKIINNTNAKMHWDITSPGQGDCGDILPGAPPYDYDLTHATLPVNFVCSFTTAIAYTINDPDAIVAVASRMDTAMLGKSS